jgi:hypothetical protein
MRMSMSDGAAVVTVARICEHRGIAEQSVEFVASIELVELSSIFSWKPATSRSTRGMTIVLVVLMTGASVVVVVVVPDMSGQSSSIPQLVVTLWRLVSALASSAIEDCSLVPKRAKATAITSK